MANLLASTSASSTHKMKRYDVFLSFRGIDTRNNFTGHLYRALQQKGIQTFIDDELRRGEEISPSLITVIRESKISIIIFFKNYASSSWCLDELVEILKCRESLGQLVWPVFFNVDPSEVINHRDSFGEALAKFGKTSNKSKEKLPNWKVSLSKASNLSWWHLANQDESQLIQRIVEAALTKLDRTLLHVAKYPVGIEDRLRELESLIYAGFGKNDDVRVIGICGIGGMGKTTIAKAIFNKFADDFEGSSFLENVRETSQQHLGMVQLQEMLLYDMLGDKNIKVGNTHRGINIIRDRLCHKRVLAILDDVDELEQLETLAGGHEWFGPGSRIIITTRNKHILTTHGANEIYEVQGLDHQRALELLSWNAFKRNKPLEDYNSLVDRIVKYADGLPLALEVLGSFLFGRKKHQWESAIHNLEKKPDKKIYEILKISYDALRGNEKAIFLDIACFFVGADINDATEVLGSSNFCPIIGIEVLLDLSLIKIEKNRLKMHHVIQEVGKEIVRQESPEAGNRSRLWSPEDIFHVFSENTGTDSIEGIMLKLHELRTLHSNANSFKKMKKLRLLIFANVVLSTNIGYISNELRLIDLPGYQFPTLPFNSGPKQLVILNVLHSRIQLLDEGFKEIPELPDYKMHLEAIDCKSLVETPCKIMAKIISNDQGFLRDSEMEATILGLEIPDWFSHKLGESVTFNMLSSYAFNRLKPIGLRLHHNLGESITFNAVRNVLMNMAAVIIYTIFQSSCTNLELSFDLLGETDFLILSLRRQKLLTTSGNTWLIFLPARDLVSECFPFFALEDQSVRSMLKYVRKIRVTFNTEWSTHSPTLVSTCAVHILRDQDQLMLDNKLIKLSHLSILRHLMKRKIDDDFAEGDPQSSRSWPRRKRQCGPSGIK